MYKIIEYQNTIGENISLACGKRLGDECANAAVDRQLIKAKILVIYYVPPNFRIHPIQREQIYNIYDIYIGFLIGGSVGRGIVYME